MCCIFTCCGWVIDLVQRIWIFLMSCVIGSAVCCVLITSSMSGVALGYNYSLAEYIETKETNVSVYLKRGVFDDEVSQDMEWRRRGHKSLNPILRDDGNLKTAEPEGGPEEMPFRRSNRRLEDSILDSNDKNNFEGSLMKLTVSPPYIKTTKTFHTNDEEMLKIHAHHTPGSLGELKDIQGLINKRKMNSNRESTIRATNNYGDQDLANIPGPAMRRSGARRIMDPPVPTPTEPMLLVREENELPKINPARYAVPDANIGSPGNWIMPKMNPETYRRLFDTNDDPPPYPQPVTVRPGTIRPTVPSSVMPHLTFQSAPARTLDPGLVTDDMDVGKFRQRNENFLKSRPGMKQPGTGSDVDYYEDDVKGIPVRKRRSLSKGKMESHKINPATKSSQIFNNDQLSEIRRTDTGFVSSSKPQDDFVSIKDTYKENRITTLKGDFSSKPKSNQENFLVTKLSQILNRDKLSERNETDKDKNQITSLKPQAKVESEVRPVLNHGQTEFKVGKSVSDAIKYYLSILLDKLNLLKKVQSAVINGNSTGNKTFLPRAKLLTVPKIMQSI